MANTKEKEGEEIMGWSKELKADKALAFPDVEKVIDSLPFRLRGKYMWKKQDWGWGMLTDICNPEGKVLCISGAFYSEQYASSMARYLAKKLRELGYKIKVGKII